MSATAKKNSIETDTLSAPGFFRQYTDTVRKPASRTSIFFPATVRKMSSIGFVFLFVLLTTLGLISLLQGASDVEFKLYTKKNPVNETNVLRNASNLEDTYFDPNKTTVVIVHGLSQNFKSKSIAVIRDAYLENTDSNVIVVNWWARSGSLHYGQGVRNAEHVAEILSDFLDNLILKSDRSLIHVIGFSQGSQIVGLAAQNMKNGPLSRIIALEPAKLIFENKDSVKRLNMDDAEFVIVIHTTGDFPFFSQSIGHADFYPNGGTSPQPGCSGKKAAVMSCSHQMASMYYAESLYNPMAFPATLCDSWTGHKNGKCSDNDQVLMGANTPSSARGSFYLETNAGTPYVNGVKDSEVVRLKDTKQISKDECTNLNNTGTCVKIKTFDILFCMLSLFICVVFMIISLMYCKLFKARLLMFRAAAASMNNGRTLLLNNQKRDYELKNINEINERIQKDLMLLADDQTNYKK